MYENPNFNSNNEKILCEMNGKNADMLMDIKTKLLGAGESVTVCDSNNETAILLLSGDVQYAFDGKTENAKRENQFVDRPYCVHFSRNNTVKVTANALNVRVKPDKKSSVKRVITKHEIYTVTKTSGEWSYLESIPGWSMTKFLQKI